MSENDSRNALGPHAEPPNGSAQSAARGQAPAASRSMAPGAPSFETRPAGAPPDEVRERKPKQQFRREKRDVHGWIVLDKAVGMTSTQAVGAIKRLFSCKRAGHAGTLDPLASGCLPIALGEATKTVPFVMDGRKTYSFTVR